MDAYLIMDGQWGSCGKGLLAGKLALDRSPDVVVCNFGPNAGHTFITKEGETIVTRQLPTGLVNESSILLIGPGAIIDPEVLEEELKRFSGPYLVDRRVMIHERTAVVLPEDKEAEQDLFAISSTRKGVGSALSRKITRHLDGSPAIARDYYVGQQLDHCVISDKTYNDIIKTAKLVQIESSQGFELSLNHGSHYPYCTSRDVTPESILNDVGFPLRYLAETNVVVRTFPIRVGNEYDSYGRLIGTSGPVYPDMQELLWEHLSQRLERTLEERTTVTGKPRRIFNWSFEQFEHMLQKLSPCQVMLNFCNYLHPTAQSFNELDIKNRDFVRRVSDATWSTSSELSWLGFGPRYDQVKDYDFLS
jgi:adenylosuccinate synthase